MSDVETLAYGYGLIEGPVVDGDGNLYFSDVPNGGVYRRSPDGEVAVAVPKRRGVGGIALHADGGLVLSGRNICHVRDGETTVLFDPGAPFNDLTVDPEGRIVCGTLRVDPFDEDAPDQPGEAYRIELDGSVTELYGGVRLTNGIAFSPDGTQAYHADTLSNHVIAHDIVDGRYQNRRALSPVDGFSPDGLVVDVEGTIWVADYGRRCVRGLDPVDGTQRAKIAVPAAEVTSLCFGGADGRDLYITTADNTDDPNRGGTVFRTRVDVPGLPVPVATVPVGA